MMRRKDFLRYVSFVRKTTGITVSEDLLETDYMVSLFLDSFHHLLKAGILSAVSNKLAFKGGTLLTKTLLDYHRISEDIDFTYVDAVPLRSIASRHQRENKIKPLADMFLNDMQLVAKDCGFHFSVSDNAMWQVHNSRAVYVLRVAYDSFFSDERKYIKVECNFLEDLQQEPVFVEAQTLPSALGLDKDFLLSLGYNLLPISLLAYDPVEVLLEKCRAVLTRKEFKDRDVLDVFLLREKGIDVLRQDIRAITKKIFAGELISSYTRKNLVACCALLRSGQIISTENVNLLLLRDIDSRAYNLFFKEFTDFLLKICVACAVE